MLKQIYYEIPIDKYKVFYLFGKYFFFFIYMI